MQYYHLYIAVHKVPRDWALTVVSRGLLPRIVTGENIVFIDGNARTQPRRIDLDLFTAYTREPIHLSVIFHRDVSEAGSLKLARPKPHANFVESKNCNARQLVRTAITPSPASEFASRSFECRVSEEVEASRRTKTCEATLGIPPEQLRMIFLP